ncbi:hypothetical protein CSA56_04105 [candidate division KSB3 bacterium]|uniref:Sigma-54 factor interaction domain-containing protein n=1 Tax=candidate division KSB3 bacterium TaxID=2044937 RepID=A0A2G6KKA6_9BACT|nr:MAG: hypothetical protein CSA56_04105 [candidate division KSB3 bacterium]
MKRFLTFFLGILSAIALLAVQYTTVPYLSSFIQHLELKTIDYRMQYSRQPDVSDAVKIVLVNDTSDLSNTLASFIHLVSNSSNGQYKPKAIGLNYRFDTTVNEDLVSAALAASNVYYGYSFSFDPDPTEAESLNNAILPFRLEMIDIGEDSFQYIIEAQHVQLPTPKYLTAARGIGFVNPLPDNDEVFRRIPLFLNYQDNWYGSLALLLAMEYLDIESVDMTFYPAQYVEITRDDGDDMKIPVNQFGAMLIGFAHDPSVGGVAPFETISIEDLLANPTQKQLEAFKDAIVLVGSGGAQPIPLASSYPLIGILANFVNNIITKQFIKELQPIFIGAIILITGMITGFIFGGNRFWIKLLSALLLAVLYVVVAYGAFFQFKLLLPVCGPLFTIGLTLISTGLLIRHKKSAVAKDTQPQPIVKEKKRKKVKQSSPDDVMMLEATLVETREELDRKSLRLRSKVEELRVIQEEVESNHYDYSRQVASLQKEIRAREIEIKGLLAKEDELRRHIENRRSTEAEAVLSGGNAENVRRIFAQQGFITQNAMILHTLARIEKLSKAPVSVLLQGEPGTGKNLLAGIIREFSDRQNRPSLQVICDGDMDMLEDDLFGHRKGAFPGADDHRAGFFRKVDGGTLVLEEIGKLSIEVQTRLIQAVRGKVIRPLGEDISYPSDVRIIATTSQNLKELVSQGKFREDLYQYFSILPLYLPPLRERKEDIPAIVNYFVAHYNRIHGKIVESVADSTIDLLIQHQWPGNIAELEKVIERALLDVPQGEKELSQRYISFEEADLTGGIQDSGMLNYLIALLDDRRELPAYQPLREKVLAEIQRLYCVRLLRLHHGDVKQASVDAGLKTETFKKMLTELMIEPEDYRY